MNHKLHPFKVGKGGARPHATAGTVGTAHLCLLCMSSSSSLVPRHHPWARHPSFTEEEAEARTVYKLPPRSSWLHKAAGKGLGTLCHAVTSGDRSLRGDLKERAPWDAVTCSKAFQEQSPLGSHVLLTKNPNGWGHLLDSFLSCMIKSFHL